ncbi:MAG: 2-C-methyl-D-erythritol 4-phosphate cytidylyltransferase, partial [Candidatus Binataceae bacterium]
MRCSVIIVAAGSGIRLKMDAPKAFVPMGGKPLLHYSLGAIAALQRIDEAIVTVPPGMERRARAEVDRAGLEIPVKLVAGGAERQDSVRIALGLTSAESEVVVVHDAARPLAPARLFERALEQLERSGADAVIAAAPVSDTIKEV